MSVPLRGEPMSCRTFRCHLRLMDALFLSEDGPWSRYFSAGPLDDYRQNERAASTG